MVRLVCFLFVLAFASPAQAESAAFCSALRRVYDEAPSNFVNVRGAPIGADSSGSSPRYATSIPVPVDTLGIPAVSGSHGCHVGVNGSNTWQQTCMYNTANDLEAVNLVDWLVQNIQTCLNAPALTVDRVSALDLNQVSVEGRHVGFVRVRNSVSLFVANVTQE